jgi:hypothetical protein
MGSIHKPSRECCSLLHQNRFMGTSAIFRCYGQPAHVGRAALAAISFGRPRHCHHLIFFVPILPATAAGVAHDELPGVVFAGRFDLCRLLLGIHGRDHVIVIRQPGEERLEHPRRRGQSVQHASITESTNVSVSCDKKSGVLRDVPFPGLWPAIEMMPCRRPARIESNGAM